MRSPNRPLGFGVRLVAAGLLFFSASLLLAEPVDSLPKPTDYVSDFAHVLSPEAIARIDNLCGQLDHSQANAQIAVVTIHTLDGMDAADWTIQLEEKWKIGKKGSDRGVLVLLAVDDHKRRIDVGYGLEGILPDAKLGDIGREMVPYLRRNDFNDAVLLAVGQVGQTIAEDAKVSLQDSEPGQPVPQPGVRVERRHSSPLGGLILLVILLVLFGGSWIFRLLFGWGLLSTLLGGNRWTGGGWGGGGWGSGGGWGGGGDSGGGGGGGGFGGFGGGDFGGGGAGGDW